jgi:hypothetical protein
MKTECVLLQIGEDAELGILVPNWAAEHLGDIVANASVVRIKVQEVVDVPVILKSYGYSIEEEGD